MARSIWTGALSFGLVNVPVGLYSATEDRSIRFNQFAAGTSDRIKYKRVNERTGDEVEFTDIVKGYDTGDGEFVVVTPDELEAVESGPSRTIDLLDFVDLEEIDPIYYQKAYYLAPTGKSSPHAYALLREAMRETKKVGIAQFVMRGKQYLVAIRASEEALILETLYFADEIRSPVEEIDTLPIEASFKPKELATAKMLIESMEAKWDPSTYKDTYRERVEELIEDKRKGGTIKTEHEKVTPTKVVDLLDALKESVDTAQKRRKAS